MIDGLISQEEIDALLNGGVASDNTATDIPAELSTAATELTEMQRDALGEIGNISMGSAATTLSVLLAHKVEITTPTVSIETMDLIKDHYPRPYLFVEVGYTHGIEGSNILAIQAADASVIADLMMGGDGTAPPGELDEMRMSAVSEAMNQMMGAVSTSLSTMFNQKIDIAPPNVKLTDLGEYDKITEIVNNDEPIVRISFRMVVGDLIDSEIMQILPLGVAKEMVANLMQENLGNEPAAAPVEVKPAPVRAAPPMAAAPAAPSYASPPPAAISDHVRVAANVSVQPAQFTPLTTEPVTVNDTNIGLILDVPLQVTVELGRTKKSIKDILELSNGAIIELDKLAGEPVDILVNGKLLAKGEVVVIDENFGVRITDIVSELERTKHLQ